MAPSNKSARCHPVATGVVITLMGLAWYVTTLSGMRTLVFNPTESAPPGFHVRVETVSLDTTIGYSTLDYRHLVAFPIPTAVANWMARRYFPRPPPANFLKPVFGLPGNELCFRDSGYYCNGIRFSESLPPTAEDGRGLPAWIGCQVLGADEVFVYSPPHPPQLRAGSDRRPHRSL